MAISLLWGALRSFRSPSWSSLSRRIVQRSSITLRTDSKAVPSPPAAGVGVGAALLTSGIRFAKAPEGFMGWRTYALGVDGFGTRLFTAEVPSYMCFISFRLPKGGLGPGERRSRPRLAMDICTPPVHADGDGLFDDLDSTCTAGKYGSAYSMRTSSRTVAPPGTSVPMKLKPVEQLRPITQWIPRQVDDHCKGVLMNGVSRVGDRRAFRQR